jgi:hypothetical protein
MTLREKLERANPTVDSPTYRRLTGKTTEQEHKRALAEELRRIEHPGRQDAKPR